MAERLSTKIAEMIFGPLPAQETPADAHVVSVNIVEEALPGDYENGMCPKSEANWAAFIMYCVEKELKPYALALTLPDTQEVVGAYWKGYIVGENGRPQKVDGFGTDSYFAYTSSKTPSPHAGKIMLLEYDPLGGLKLTYREPFQTPIESMNAVRTNWEIWLAHETKLRLRKHNLETATLTQVVSWFESNNNQQEKQGIATADKNFESEGVVLGS